MSGCIFCKIIAGEIPSKIVWQDENVVAFRDISPLAPTHVLIVPRKHLVTFSDFSAGDGPIMTSLAVAVREVAKLDGVLESGYRLIVNNGPDGGQEVMHVHMHLLGGRNIGPMIKRSVPEG